MLSILLAGTSIGAAVVSCHVLVSGTDAGAGATGELLRNAILFLPIAAALGALNRLGRVRLAATLFVVVGTTMVLLNGPPQQIVDGQLSLFFVLPVLTASVVLFPASSFLVLVGISASLFVLAQSVDAPFPALHVAGVSLVALVAWLSAQTVECALANSRRLNAELEKRVELRTQELSEAADGLQRAQAAQIQSSKMAAIGQLAAGIAHEINNPLGVMLGFAQGIERRLHDQDPSRGPVSSIVREALRCKRLVDGLLLFSRTKMGERAPIDLNEVVNSTAVLLRARANALDTTVVTDLSEKPAVVIGDTAQLQQVLVDLGNNALDASQSGGSFTLRTAEDQNGNAILEVADSGAGIPNEIRHRVFEPFFTTKDVGRGVGLGLSLAWEVVQQHGGNVDIESNEGTGTTIRIRLPLATGGVPREARRDETSNDVLDVTT